MTDFLTNVFAKRPDRTSGECAKLAKKWGVKRGYIGRSGGWIYHDDDAIVQGWLGLYLKYWRKIEADISGESV